MRSAIRQDTLMRSAIRGPHPDTLMRSAIRQDTLMRSAIRGPQLGPSDAFKAHSRRNQGAFNRQRVLGEGGEGHGVGERKARKAKCCVQAGDTDAISGN